MICKAFRDRSYRRKGPRVRVRKGPLLVIRKLRAIRAEKDKV